LVCQVVVAGDAAQILLQPSGCSLGRPCHTLLRASFDDRVCRFVEHGSPSGLISAIPPVPQQAKSDARSYTGDDPRQILHDHL
jgi:hypothetical protein